MSIRRDAVSATRISYDRVAAAYAAHVADELAGKPMDRALIGVLLELTHPGIVADIGCGPGHVMAELAARAAPGTRVIGLDLSPAMCGLAGCATSLPVCAADMTCLPLGSGSLTGLLSWYAVIHLDDDQRAAAYREFHRVLGPGGHALIAFHTRDQDIAPGGHRTMGQWFDRDVELTFRFLNPAVEADALAWAGFTVVARLDRQHHPGTEYPSDRTYLLVRH